MTIDNSSFWEVDTYAEIATGLGYVTSEELAPCASSSITLAEG